MMYMTIMELNRKSFLETSLANLKYVKIKMIHFQINVSERNNKEKEKTFEMEKNENTETCGI